MLKQPTQEALAAVALAGEEAGLSNAPLIAPEHLFLGILREGTDHASRILKTHGVRLRRARNAVESLDPMPLRRDVKSGAGVPWPGPQADGVRGRLLSPRTHRAVAAAVGAAEHLGHDRLTPAHLLLALLIDADDSVAKILHRLGADRDKTRRDVLASLGADLESTKVKQILDYATAPGHDRPDDKAILQVGIVGVSGYGGGEVLRLCATHPLFNVAYVAGESSAGQRLDERFPGIGELGQLTIQKWDPQRLPDLDLLFASLPSGDSKAALAQVSSQVRIVDIGGDHRFAEGWVYGLADVWPELIRGATRVANPGCYPAASLAALAPLIAAKIVEPAGIIIDAKTGVSGAGRGGGNTFGFADVNEDVSAYGLLKHVHVPEMSKALGRLAGIPAASLTFTPHLIPMTRGILATCYARGQTTTEACFDAAQKFYQGRPFVRVLEKPPHTKWASGSNLAFVSYVADADRAIVIALGAIDNLGKGAAGQAVQNANLMLGLPETIGLEAAPLWP